MSMPNQNSFVFTSSALSMLNGREKEASIRTIVHAYRYFYTIWNIIFRNWKTCRVLCMDICTYRYSSIHGISFCMMVFCIRAESVFQIELHSAIEPEMWMLHCIFHIKKNIFWRRVIAKELLTRGRREVFWLNLSPCWHRTFNSSRVKKIACKGVVVLGH